MQARDIWRRKRVVPHPGHELWAARETARRGDVDAAIEVMRRAVDELRQAGRPFFGVWGTGVLVESLLERGAAADLAEAKRRSTDCRTCRPDHRLGVRRYTLLRLRALLARPAATTLPTATS